MIAILDIGSAHTAPKLLTMDSRTTQETLMKTSHWLTLAAAIMITAIEAWVFTGESATAVEAAGTTADVVLSDRPADAR